MRAVVHAGRPTVGSTSQVRWSAERIDPRRRVEPGQPVGVPLGIVLSIVLVVVDAANEGFGRQVGESLGLAFGVRAERPAAGVVDVATTGAVTVGVGRWGGRGEGGGDDLGRSRVGVAEPPDQGAVGAAQGVELVVREVAVGRGGSVGVEDREDLASRVGERARRPVAGERRELLLGDGSGRCVHMIQVVDRAHRAIDDHEVVLAEIAVGERLGGGGPLGRGGRTVDRDVGSGGRGVSQQPSSVGGVQPQVFLDQAAGAAMTGLLGDGIHLEPVHRSVQARPCGAQVAHRGGGLVQPRESARRGSGRSVEHPSSIEHMFEYR